MGLGHLLVQRGGVVASRYVDGLLIDDVARVGLLDQIEQRDGSLRQALDQRPWNRRSSPPFRQGGRVEPDRAEGKAGEERVTNELGSPGDDQEVGRRGFDPLEHGSVVDVARLDQLETPFSSDVAQRRVPRPVRERRVVADRDPRREAGLAQRDESPSAQLESCGITVGTLRTRAARTVSHASGPPPSLETIGWRGWQRGRVRTRLPGAIRPPATLR